MDAKLIRMLERLAVGEAPRCSQKEFEALHALLPGKLQRESRYGADTSGGYILTPLRSSAETSTAIQGLLAGQSQT